MWKYASAVTNNAAFHRATSTKNGRSLFIWTVALWNDTFSHFIYMWRWGREERHGVTASSFLPVALSPLPCPLSLKYDPLPAAPTTPPPPSPPPSPFSQLKSTGHVCFIRNDKCCTLAVPLPTSHLSWLETFYSCQLFHLTLTQTPRKSSWWGGASERALSVREKQHGEAALRNADYKTDGQGVLTRIWSQNVTVVREMSYPGVWLKEIQC